MRVVITIIVDETVYKPKGFYYKGKGGKTKVVMVGGGKLDNYEKKTFPVDDCIILCDTYNSLGDKF